MRRLLTITLLILLGFASANGAQLDCTDEGFPTDTLAFPNAPGYGGCAHGGRGGSVCKVTNLNDSGAGSLRNCVLSSGARNVIFDISGKIILDSDSDGEEDNVHVDNGNIRIACQTAPSPGILIQGAFEFDGQNNFIEHCNFVVDETLESPDSTDCGVSVGSGTPGEGDHTMVRNVSCRGGHDESISIWGANFVTIYRSTMDKPLVRGPLMGAPGCGNISWHQNITGYAFERAPLVKGCSPLELVQNVSVGSTYIALWEQDGKIEANVIANALFYGDTTQSHAENGWLQGESSTPLTDDGDPAVFLDGNFHPVQRASDALSESAGVINDPGVSIIVNVTPFDTPLSSVTGWGRDTYGLIRNVAGALVPASSEIRDDLIADIDETQNFLTTFAPCTSVGSCGGQQTFCSTIACAGGIPTFASNSRAAGHDDDDDGVPDAVETACFGDTTSVDGTVDVAGPSGSIFVGGDGFTVLEDYLNAIANMDNVKTDANIIAECGQGMFGGGTWFVSTTGSAANNCVSATDTERNEGDSISDVITTCICGGGVTNASVIVDPGVYAEKLNITCPVKVQQTGGTVGTVDLDLQGATAPGDGDAGILITSSNVTVEDLRVINARLSNGTNTMGVKVGSSADSIILNGISVLGAEANGILIDEGTPLDPHSDITIANVTVDDTDGNGGIKITNGERVTIINSTVDDSHSSNTEDNGIECLDCDGLLLIGNTVKNHCDGFDVGSADSADATGTNNVLLRDNLVDGWNQRQSAASCGSDVRAYSVSGQSSRGATAENVVFDSNRAHNAGTVGTGLELYDGVGLTGAIEVYGFSCFDVDGRCVWARGAGTFGDNGALGTVVLENIAGDSTSTNASVGVVEILDPNSAGAGVSGQFLQLFRSDSSTLFRSETSSGISSFIGTDIAGSVPNFSVFRTDEPLFDSEGLHLPSSPTLGRGQAVRVLNCGVTTSTLRLDRDISNRCFGATGCVHTMFGQDQILGTSGSDTVFLSGIMGGQEFTAFNPATNEITLKNLVRLEEGSQLSFVDDLPSGGLPIGAQK